MLWVFAVPAFAEPTLGETTFPVLEDLEPKRIVGPDFPSMTWEGTVSCWAILTVDGTGAVTEVEVEQPCLPPFEASIRRAALLWVYQPLTENDVPITVRARVRFSFRSATPSRFTDLWTVEQLQTVKDATAPLSPPREDGGACRMAITAHQSGDASGLSSNDSRVCLLLPTGGVETSKKVWKVATAPATCTGTFVVTGETLSPMAWSGCDDVLQRAAGAMVRRWELNGTNEGLAYELSITFAPGAP